MNLRSYNYSFKFKQGQSMPEAHLPANSDDHFFNTVLPAWEKETGFKCIDDSVTCTVSETRKVPEPVATENYDGAALRAAGERILPASIDVAHKVAERFGRQT